MKLPSNILKLKWLNDHTKWIYNWTSRKLKWWEWMMMMMITNHYKNSRSSVIPKRNHKRIKWKKKKKSLNAQCHNCNTCTLLSSIRTSLALSHNALTYRNKGIMLILHIQMRHRVKFTKLAHKVQNHPEVSKDSEFWHPMSYGIPLKLLSSSNLQLHPFHYSCLGKPFSIIFLCLRISYPPL